MSEVRRPSGMNAVSVTVHRPTYRNVYLILSTCKKAVSNIFNYSLRSPKIRCTPLIMFSCVCDVRR